MMNPLFMLLSMILNTYSMVLIVWIVMSWLIHFQILNRHQPLVSRLDYILYRLTDPVLRPIRRYLPPLGGIDLSPIILFMAIHFLDYTLHYIAFAM
jgi:YggT family protein